MSCLNDIECYIEGYTVVAQAGAETGTVDFVLQDTCKTLRDQCRLKAVLAKVAKDWLASIDSEETINDSEGCQGYWSECQTTGENVVLFAAAKTLTLTTAETAPAAPLTAFVPLPLDCKAPVVFV